MGRAAVRRLDGSQTQHPGPDWFDRSGIGCIRPLPGCRRPRVRPAPGKQQWVVAEVDEVCRQRRGVTPRARGGATSRAAAAGVDHVAITVHRHSCGNAVADGNRLARAQLDRRLDQWRKRYPDLDVGAVAVHGNTLNFLTKNADSIQLLVVGHERAQGITALVGPPGYAALHDADCSVLICEPQNVL